MFNLHEDWFPLQHGIFQRFHQAFSCLIQPMCVTAVHNKYCPMCLSIKREIRGNKWVVCCSQLKSSVSKRSWIRLPHPNRKTLSSVSRALWCDYKIRPWERSSLVFLHENWSIRYWTLPIRLFLPPLKTWMRDVLPALSIPMTMMVIFLIPEAQPQRKLMSEWYCTSTKLPTLTGMGSKIGGHKCHQI